MKRDEKAAITREAAVTSRAAKQTERLSAKALKEAEKKAVKAFKETEKAETAEKKVAMKVQAGRKRKGKTDATESTSAADETSSLGTELPLVPAIPATEELPDFVRAPESMTITEELNMLQGNWPNLCEEPAESISRGERSIAKQMYFLLALAAFRSYSESAICVKRRSIWPWKE